MRAAASSVLLALSLSACVVTHDVPLDLVGLDEGHPAGFGCRVPSATGGGPFLVETIAPDLAACAMSCDHGMCRRAAFVFDFVEVGGVPSCRAGALVDWCADPGRCRVVARRCFEVDACVAAADPTSYTASVSAGIRAASGGVILESAPDATVLVRAIGSAQSCEEIVGSGLASEAVFGCAYSCPAQLDTVEGPLQLDLDAFDDECGALALGCALFVSGEAPVP